MALFDILPLEGENKQEISQSEIVNRPKIKLKKGQTIDTLIETARSLVNEKLGAYKDRCKCILDLDELKAFFNRTNELISIDTETTGLNTFSDELVGICLGNETESIYVPINHKSPLYNTKLKNQIKEQDIKNLFKEVLDKRKEFKWIWIGPLL